MGGIHRPTIGPLVGPRAKVLAWGGGGGGSTPGCFWKHTLGFARLRFRMNLLYTYFAEIVIQY